MRQIVFERLDGNNLEIPQYKTIGAAAFDLAACLSRPCMTKDKIKFYAHGDRCRESGHRYYENSNYYYPCVECAPALTLEPNETILVPTGWKTDFSSDLCLNLFPRSSTGTFGIVLANDVAVIDSDYRGELLLAIYNRTGSHTTIKHGDRIAQGVFVKIERCAILPGEVSDSTRGGGGFGSTGSA